MLVVLNKNYGGFEIPDEVFYDKNFFGGWGCDELKTRSQDVFVNWVKKHPESDLGLVEIPDGFTDYYIDEYDGLESLIYVLDGKIHWAKEIENDE